jgi:hypothetical protein
MKRIIAAGIISALMSSTATFAADATETQGIQQFAAYSETSNSHVDYQVWSDLLRDIVLNVPRMDRNPERTRTINTGTRTSTANETRYRNEANRVVYHLLSDEYKEAITFYRQDLEAIPDQIDLASLSSNEQLAYWMNLHNVAIIEQVMLDYPTTRINRLTAAGTNENVFEAKILTVAGVPLSLNDIRLRIVYAHWDDPRVMYGFFNGSIGGPEIRREAYDGRRIWAQLDNNAREFVNSLRGVETSQRDLRVSHIYQEAERLFPDFETDLRTHLARYAEATTRDQLAPGRRLRANINEWHIADLINGSTRCTGTGGASTMSSASYNTGNQGDRPGTNTALSCAQMPTNGLVLMDAVMERRLELFREGRYGEVQTVDIPTDENGNEFRLQPAADTSEDEE